MNCFRIIIALALSLCVSADETATARAFRRYKIVPDVIPEPPNNEAYVRFKTGAQVRLGNVLKDTQVSNFSTRFADMPKLSFVA